MVFFEILLGIARVVAGPLVEAEGGVVAGVAEEHGAHFLVGAVDAEDGHVVIDGALRIGAVDEATFGGESAIHGDAATRAAIGQAGGREIGKRFVDEGLELRLQPVVVGEGLLSVFRVDRTGCAPGPQLRAAMGV